MGRSHRGDLSAPVLAIIVTIGVIAAGLVLMAWFWWFAPQAGRAGTLQILGQPAIVGGEKEWVVYVSVRNVGNADMTISEVVVRGLDCVIKNRPLTLRPGDSQVVNATCIGAIADTEHVVPALIITEYGTYPVNLIVVRK